MEPHLRMVVVSLLLSLVGGSAWAGKDDFTEWQLDVHFINGSTQGETATKARIQEWVDAAEHTYRRNPALKITWTYEARSTQDGKNLSQMLFDNSGQYARFMDENFDNVAVTKTDGHLTVLITDKLCIGKDCWGGMAHFPHSVNPFSSKRGITMLATKDAFTFAHELGHVFGLKHTFEPYVGLKRQCNEDYKPKGRPQGECNSCGNGKVIYDSDNNPSACDGPSNIMDYCGSTLGEEFLNTCQEERAAQQRRLYMTTKGETNYFKLKGLAGEEICKEDSECGDGFYCGKGIAHNQCLALEDVGSACTRDGACDSGRCNLFKCAEAHDCLEDGDCGTGFYCNLGVASAGRNECKALLADGKACTKDHQCSTDHCSPWRPQDGQASGICYTPASKDGGEACAIDLECKTGKCNSSKKCVCKKDSDCGGNQWCDAGADLKDNVCKPKLASGEKCGVGIDIGHRCLSGKCNFGKCK